MKTSVVLTLLAAIGFTMSHPFEADSSTAGDIVTLSNNKNVEESDAAAAACTFQAYSENDCHGSSGNVVSVDRSCIETSGRHSFVGLQPLMRDQY